VLDYKTYTRKPFPIKAIQITEENIHEVAKFIGEVRHKDDEHSTPYILIDERIVQKVPKAYIGFWVTKVGEHYRCFTRRAFREQYDLAEEKSDGI
jgi:hypothetical protein